MNKMNEEYRKEEEGIKAKQSLISVSLDSDGYFDGLLLKTMEATRITNKSKAVKYGIMCAARDTGAITQDEFEEGAKYRL